METILQKCADIKSSLANIEEVELACKDKSEQLVEELNVLVNSRKGARWSWKLKGR